MVQMSDAEFDARWADAELREAGLVDQDAPSLWATIAARCNAEAEFTPRERHLIRILLDLPTHGGEA